MDEHGARPDPRWPLDPRVAMARHRDRIEPSAGLQYLRALTAQEREWMRRMVTRTARAYGVDRDDLMQELQLSLLRSNSIDGGRREVRGWLKRRAQWRATELLGKDRVRRQHTWSFDEVTAPEPIAPHPAGPDPDWSIDRLAGLRLNRDEAQVVLLVLWGLDISMRDFAELVDRSYAKTRQDKVRGLRKIEELFDLDPEERAAFIAYREYGTVTAAATRLGITEERLRRLGRSAERKINRALGHAENADVRRDEDDSDAG
jgi:DNA-directed RNA polymerase specialized sigma24 family protein